MLPFKSRENEAGKGGELCRLPSACEIMPRCQAAQIKRADLASGRAVKRAANADVSEALE